MDQAIGTAAGFAGPCWGRSGGGPPLTASSATAGLVRSVSGAARPGSDGFARLKSPGV
jgi:hypothetical protein